MNDAVVIYRLTVDYDRCNACADVLQQITLFVRQKTRIISDVLIILGNHRGMRNQDHSYAIDEFLTLRTTAQCWFLVRTKFYTNKRS